MSWKYYTKALKWRSRYSLLYFHVIVRIASQACGVAFGINGFSNMGVFLAYLILGAEGYFTLVRHPRDSTFLHLNHFQVLCAYRFLISWHEHNHPSHKSWLETTEMFTSPKARRPLIRATVWLMAGILTPFLDYYTPIFIIHCILLLGNTLIITGGSFVANSTKEGADERKVAKNAIISKALRTSGQSFFLGVNVLLFFAIAWTIFSARQKRQGASDGARRRIHPTLILLSVAWIPLMIRGIFGVLQAAVFRLSYNNSSSSLRFLLIGSSCSLIETNYNKHGMKPHFLAMEYGLGVATEWVA